MSEHTTTSIGEVSLPMYDFAELRDAHDTLWAAIRRQLSAHGIVAPVALTHDDDVVGLWNSPRLGISQACGWPIVHDLVGVAVPFGTFVFDAPGVEGPRYRMRITTADQRTGDVADLLDEVAAVNAEDSLSGRLSLLAAGGVQRAWPGGTLSTGAHVESIRALREGRAAIASIDAVTLAILTRYRPDDVTGLRVIAEGPLVGGLPLIVPAGTDAAAITAIRAAFHTAVHADETREARDALGLVDFVAVDIEHYAPVLRLGRELGLLDQPVD
jgi:ABC-type phosphate/phosphonate transport system substrate-binding protein